LGKIDQRRFRFDTCSSAFVAVLALFLVLGAVYSVVTPVFEASDERWHYPVVKYIADRHQLPVQDPTRQTDWHQEGSQPPLYYMLAAALTASVDTDDFEDVLTPNPHAVVGEPLIVGNKNMMVHTDREKWPWQGTTLAVHLIRLLSVAMGGVTVWLTWHIAGHLWPRGSHVALLAAALTAFNPMFLFISASVNNDNLAALLAAGAMLVLLKSLSRGQTVRDGLWLGTLLGLGAITKLSVLALAPIAVAALGWDAARGQSAAHPRARQTWLANLALMVVMVALIAGWWYWRNWTLYGDPSGLNRMLEIAGHRHEPLTLSRLWYEFEGFRISYWALFGALNILLDRWIYTVLDVLTIAAAVGLAVVCAKCALDSRLPADERQLTPAQDSHLPHKRSDSRLLTLGLLVVISWVVLTLISLLRWTSQTYASQGRLMFVAIAGISALLAIGLAALMPPVQLPGTTANRLRALMAGLVVSGLFILATVSPFYYILPAYARPPLLTQADLPTDVQRVNWTIARDMKMLGYRLEATRELSPLSPSGNRGLPPTVRPIEAVPLTVYWEALRPMTANYSVFVHLLGRQRAVVGQVNTYPGLGAWPTTQLQPGDVVADTYRVPVAADADAPSLLRINIGLYRYDDPGRPALESINADGARVEPWLTTAKLIPWDWPKPLPAHPLTVHLGEAITLLGYDLSRPTSSDARWLLTFYWQADGRPAADYTVFIQLWDTGRQTAGFDGQPVGGDYPTGWWEAGETIVDEHVLDLSALLPGQYRVLTGMYRLDTGERLTATGPDGPLPDNAVRLIDIDWQAAHE
jgi:4-amino-4-deoxy-L-arabinose transferase-like glycosyltransferase